MDCCGGLPLLIIVTGRALTEENNVLVWEHAAKQFSKSIANATTGKVTQLLKFSFVLRTAQIASPIATISG